MAADKPKLRLPDVTLVSIDTVTPELTRLAIKECTDRVDFGDVLQFSTDTSNKDAFHIEPFPDLTTAGHFTSYEVPKQIKTSHALFIHYDSWVLDTGMWEDAFLADYIGAPWWYRDGLNVGNSGFCIRSKALMDYLSEHRDEFPMKMPEDHWLCREYRRKLPFKWADEPVAQRFSFERARPSLDSRHFGYHGMFNWPFVLSYEEFNERMALAKRNAYIKKTNMLDELFGLWKARYGAAQGNVYRG